MPRKSKSAPAHAALALPEELTIYTVGELHRQWLAWLETLPPDASMAELLGDVVDQVDAAGLQLLLALDQTMTARGQAWVLPRPSAALRSSCDAIGLGPWLQAHEAPMTGAAA